MKERPIIFNGDMVRAILDGRKVQTRRPILQGIDEEGQPAGAVCPAAESGWIAWWPGTEANIAEFTKRAYLEGFPCPFGQPGDRLWVRETWGTVSTFDEVLPAHIPMGTRSWPSVWYAADPGAGGLYQRRANHAPFAGKVRPSIHMPRWASRLTLEITDIRVQRLQKITEDESEAEGVEIGGEGQVRTQWNYYVDAFACAWDSIYARRNLGWSADPWVWAITFRRLEQTHDCPPTPNSANCGISGGAA